MRLAHRYRTVLPRVDEAPWRPIDVAFGSYKAFSQQLAAAGRLGPRLTWRLFSPVVIEDQDRVARILAEGARQQRHLTGAYLNLFYVPFRSYGGTTVSDEGGEGDVQQENNGRKEHRELALADGTCVLVREIQPGDASALQRLVGRLSEQTIHLRYFGPMKQLSDKQARYFAEVDGQDRYALVALDPENCEEIVAVVRYDREKGTDRAEYAALVEDRLQGRGLGIALTRSLIEAARERGIRDFEALVLPENRGMLRLLRSLDLPESAHQEDGVRRVSVDLFPEQRSAENQKDGERASG
jgi:RimJ/RimL family protein N-acetyltransferase